MFQIALCNACSSCIISTNQSIFNQTTLRIFFFHDGSPKRKGMQPSSRRVEYQHYRNRNDKPPTLQRISEPAANMETSKDEDLSGVCSSRCARERESRAVGSSCAKNRRRSLPMVWDRFYPVNAFAYAGHHRPEGNIPGVGRRAPPVPCFLTHRNMQLFREGGGDVDQQHRETLVNPRSS